MQTIGKHLIGNYQPRSSSSNASDVANVKLLIPDQDAPIGLELNVNEGHSLVDAVRETVWGVHHKDAKETITVHDAKNGRNVTRAFAKNAVHAAKKSPQVKVKINGSNIKRVHAKLFAPARYSPERSTHLERYAEKAIIGARATTAGLQTSEIHPDLIKLNCHVMEHETGYRCSDETVQAVKNLIGEALLAERMGGGGEDDDQVIMPVKHVDSDLHAKVVRTIKEYDALMDLVPIELQYNNKAERKAVDAEYDRLLEERHGLVRVDCYYKDDDDNDDDDDEDDERMLMEREGMVPLQAHVPIPSRRKHTKSKGVSSISNAKCGEGLVPLQQNTSQFVPIRSEKPKGLPNVANAFAQNVELQNYRGVARTSAKNVKIQKGGKFIQFATSDGLQHTVVDGKKHYVNGKDSGLNVSCRWKSLNSYTIHFA